jgi:hypothetical protein
LELLSKFLEGLVGKVVENQTANACVGIKLAEVLKKIAADPLDFARKIVRPHDQIQTGHRGLWECLMDFTAQSALACADLQNPIQGGTLCPELPHQPPCVAQIPVNQSQIGPAPDRTRICGIERIEDLGDDDAIRLRHWGERFLQGRI